MLAAIGLNRLECVGETLRHALNRLAGVAPEWLLAHSSADWVEPTDIGSRSIGCLPADNTSCVREVIGADGLCLLTAIDGTDTPAWLQTRLRRAAAPSLAAEL